jgi:hypothetical protein
MCPVHDDGEVQLLVEEDALVDQHLIAGGREVDGFRDRQDKGWIKCICQASVVMQQNNFPSM